MEEKRRLVEVYTIRSISGLTHIDVWVDFVARLQQISSHSGRFPSIYIHLHIHQLLDGSITRLQTACWLHHWITAPVFVPVISRAFHVPHPLNRPETQNACTPFPVTPFPVTHNSSASNSATFPHPQEASPGGYSTPEPTPASPPEFPPASPHGSLSRPDTQPRIDSQMPPTAACSTCHCQLRLSTVLLNPTEKTKKLKAMRILALIALANNACRLAVLPSRASVKLSTV